MSLKQVESKIEESVRYVEQLGWWLTVIRGIGENPKAPLFKGWVDFRPSSDYIRAQLEHNWEAGIGLNLGGSQLIDVEADTDDGELFIDDLCRGCDFPCWQSRRGKHRLFLANDDDIFFKDDALKIEFRTGRHQSVLPPSTIDATEYRWICDPFTIPVPPLPDGLRQFYDEHRPKQRTKPSIRQRNGEFQYRDSFDYVLRNFDLLDQVQSAGLRLVHATPDANGNVTCFVPEKLRGRPDRHYSGCFNIKSGVLRDFATGINHKFFNVMAALTNRPWLDLLQQFKEEANAQKGRPHSQRISLPTVWTEERKSLEEARSELNAYFDAQLERAAIPKTLHIIKGAAGLGKTFGLCGKLNEKNKRAVVLTLENELADHHSKLLPRSKRMPVLRTSGCIMPDEYEATSRRGFKPSQGFPCHNCSIGTARCEYLRKFGSLESADQLCCAAIYHTHADFYSSHGNNTRDIVVFDENCVDLILEPIVTKLDQWQAWLFMAMQSGEDVGAFQDLVEWMSQVQSEFLAIATLGDKPKFVPIDIPIELKETVDSASIESWLNANVARYPNVRNLLREAAYLLTEPTSHILLERIEKDDGDVILIRFRKKNPLPEDKEVFILDATANEELIRAIAKGWDVRVWDCPPIKQAGRIIQIMDYDLSRYRIRGE